MPMPMTLGNVQPHAERHQRAGDGRRKRRGLVLDQDGVEARRKRAAWPITRSKAPARAVPR